MVNLLCSGTPEPASIRCTMSIERPDRSQTFWETVITKQERSQTASRPQNASPSQQKEVDWVALGVELALRLAIAVTSGLLLMRLTKSFFELTGYDDGENDPPANTKAVYKRLWQILEKRDRRDRSANPNLSSPKYSSCSQLPPLNSYERKMADEVLDPDTIESSFAEIGGLDNIKQEIYELAILPLLQPELYQGKLVQPCKGILLYGKPGTGKTMLAKAIAKEAHAIFLPLQLSKILNKWVGESNKLIAATFSLAHKLQPAIIFIDELDTFLKANNTETAYLDAIKAEFLTLWDGIATASRSRVLVLGATNKPQTIDPAILRRMPRAFEVPLPNEEGRRSILNLLVQGEHVEQEALDFVPELARITAGYSGSDLKELCKAAAMVSIQERSAEFSRQRVMGESAQNPQDLLSKEQLRPISKQDLLTGLHKVKRTGEAARTYGREETRRTAEQEAPSVDANSLRGLAVLLRNLSQPETGQGDEIPNIR